MEHTPTRDTDAESSHPAAAPARPRRAVGALFVAGLYFALLLCAPLLLRFGPEPDVTTAVARVSVEAVERLANCATASGPLTACTASALPARTRAWQPLFEL